jgi:hypothetical protein
MAGTLLIPLLLICYVPATLLVHGLINRILAASGFGLPNQTSAFWTSYGNVLFFSALTLLLRRDSINLVPETVYCFLCFFAFATIYSLFFCVTESGRRYHLCDLVDAQPGLQKEKLMQTYGSGYMVNIRLRRLAGWGVVYEQNGRFFLKKGWMYRAALLFYTWSRLLGFRWLDFNRTVNSNKSLE